MKVVEAPEDESTGLFFKRWGHVRLASETCWSAKNRVLVSAPTADRLFFIADDGVYAAKTSAVFNALEAGTDAQGSTPDLSSLTLCRLDHADCTHLSLSTDASILAVATPRRVHLHWTSELTPGAHEPIVTLSVDSDIAQADCRGAGLATRLSVVLADGRTLVCSVSELMQGGGACSEPPTDSWLTPTASGLATCAAVAPDGSCLALGFSSGAVELFDASSRVSSALHAVESSECDASRGEALSVRGLSWINSHALLVAGGMEEGGVELDLAPLCCLCWPGGASGESTARLVSSAASVEAEFFGANVAPALPLAAGSALVCASRGAASGWDAALLAHRLAADDHVKVVLSRPGGAAEAADWDGGVVSCSITHDALAIRLPCAADDADNYVAGAGLDLQPLRGSLPHPLNPDAPDLPPQPSALLATSDGVLRVYTFGSVGEDGGLGTVAEVEVLSRWGTGGKTKWEAGGEPPQEAVPAAADPLAAAMATPLGDDSELEEEEEEEEIALEQVQAPTEQSARSTSQAAAVALPGSGSESEWEEEEGGGRSDEAETPKNAAIEPLSAPPPPRSATPKLPSSDADKPKPAAATPLSFGVAAGKVSNIGGSPSKPLFGGFGGGAGVSSPSSLFGASTTSTPSLFGPSASSTPRLFGASSTTAPSLFGASTTTAPSASPVSASSTPSLFGASTAPNLFNAPAPASSKPAPPALNPPAPARPSFNFASPVQTGAPGVSTAPPSPALSGAPGKLLYGKSAPAVIVQPASPRAQGHAGSSDAKRAAVARSPSPSPKPTAPPAPVLRLGDAPEEVASIERQFLKTLSRTRALEASMHDAVKKLTAPDSAETRLVHRLIGRLGSLTEGFAAAAAQAAADRGDVDALAGGVRERLRGTHALEAVGAFGRRAEDEDEAGGSSRLALDPILAAARDDLRASLLSTRVRLDELESCVSLMEDRARGAPRRAPSSQDLYDAVNAQTRALGGVLGALSELEVRMRATRDACGRASFPLLGGELEDELGGGGSTMPSMPALLAATPPPPSRRATPEASPQAERTSQFRFGAASRTSPWRAVVEGSHLPNSPANGPGLLVLRSPGPASSRAAEGVSGELLAQVLRACQPVDGCGARVTEWGHETRADEEWGGGTKSPATLDLPVHSPPSDVPPIAQPAARPVSFVNIPGPPASPRSRAALAGQPLSLSAAFQEAPRAVKAARSSGPTPSFGSPSPVSEPWPAPKESRPSSAGATGAAPAPAKQPAEPVAPAPLAEPATSAPLAKPAIKSSQPPIPSFAQLQAAQAMAKKVLGGGGGAPATRAPSKPPAHAAPPAPVAAVPPAAKSAVPAVVEVAPAMPAAPLASVAKSAPFSEAAPTSAPAFSFGVAPATGPASGLSASAPTFQASSSAPASSSAAASSAAAASEARGLALPSLGALTFGAGASTGPSPSSASTAFGGFGGALAAAAPTAASSFGESAFGASAAAPSSGFGVATPSSGFAAASTTGNVFGTASTGTAFGAASTTGSIFGAASTGTAFGAASTTGNVFGTPSTGTAFGAASTTGNVFGTASTGTAFGAASTTGNVFGTASTGTAFGAASTTGNVFGTPSTGTAFGAASTTGSIFGTASTGTAFGAASTGNVFGTASSPAMFRGASASEFGQPTAFGTRTAPGQPAAGGFGSSAFSASALKAPAASQGSAFGAPSAPQGSAFGAPAAPHGSAFGAPSAPQGSAFGAPATPQGGAFGTPVAPQGSAFGSLASPGGGFGGFGSAAQAGSPPLFGGASQAGSSAFAKAAQSPGGFGAFGAAGAPGFGGVAGAPSQQPPSGGGGTLWQMRK